MFSFIDESRGSKFIKATVNQNPSFKFFLQNQKRRKEGKLISVTEFIDVKGWKASGNKLPVHLRMSGFKFIDGELQSDDDIVESIVDIPENAKTIEKNDNKDENNDNEDLTLFFESENLIENHN